MFSLKYPEKHIEFPERTCLLAYRGSIAHGMFVPGSDPNSIGDIDLMGVVIGEPKHYFGLHEWGSRGTREEKQPPYDCVYYELRKMVSLLLQGNPNVLSLLWTNQEHRIICGEAGKELITNRHLFVGRHVYNAFAGYAYAQLQKMETRNPAELRTYLALTAEAKQRGIHPNDKGIHVPYPEGHDAVHGEGYNAHCMADEILLTHLRSYMKKGENIGHLGDKRKQLVLKVGFDAKNAAHCIRLLRMCREFLEAGELKVFRTEDAAELLEIKRGEWSLEAVKALAEDSFQAAKSARDNSVLPEEPDRQKVEELLISILRKEIFL